MDYELNKSNNNHMLKGLQTKSNIYTISINKDY